MKRKIRDWANLVFPGCWRYSPRGGPFAAAGTPDELILWEGIFIAIEVKSIDGYPTELQLKNLRDIQKAGGVAAIVRGYDKTRLSLIQQIVYQKLADRAPK